MQNPLLAPSAFLLKDRVAALTEYELICLLKEHCDFIPDAFAGDSLSLFRTHFLLFNALYNLQASWLEDGLGYLTVDALSIQLMAFERAGSTTVSELIAAESVTLKEYYLDINNLTEMDRQDVDNLLVQFWEKYTASDQRIGALRVLGLVDPVTRKGITLAYRRKAMLLHPDRGGDVVALQEVNEAMDQLKKYYQ